MLIMPYQLPSIMFMMIKLCTSFHAIDQLIKQARSIHKHEEDDEENFQLLPRAEV